VLVILIQQITATDQAIARRGGAIAESAADAFMPEEFAFEYIGAEMSVSGPLRPHLTISIKRGRGTKPGRVCGKCSLVVKIDTANSLVRMKCDFLL
jgi:hypothetical protein